MNSKFSNSRNSKFSKLVSDKSTKYLSKNLILISKKDPTNYRTEDSNDYTGTNPRDNGPEEELIKK